ncbi:MAG: hypothetical protein FGM32_03720 [Candidatus Kapabacteria bacterium]|nr:hypothetical protein [Candidatus Kapabacteria bacterium]
MKKHMLILVILAILGPLAMWAQTPPTQPGTQPGSQPNAPLELPDFLVTGKALVDVASAAKHVPTRPPTFTLAELDSLNPTEKLPPPLASRRPLPLFMRKDDYSPGYVDVSGGAYLTPSLQAGYSMRTGGYTLDLAGGIEHSQGWVDGSGYTTAQARLNSSYVAPEKFIFFGKGLTETDVQLRHQAYSLYADTAGMGDRSSLSLLAGVQTEAKIENVDVIGTFGWTNIGLTTSDGDTQGNGSASDNAITANVSCAWSGGGDRSTVDVDLRLQSLNGNSYSFIEAQYGRGWKAGAWTVGVSAGPQIGWTTANETRPGLMARASAQNVLSPNSTLRLELSSGMRPTSFADLFRMNPYLGDSVAVDHAYDLVDARALITWQPSVATSLLATVGARSTARERTWEDGNRGTFIVSYRPVTALWASVEGSYSVSPRDLIYGEMQLMMTSTDSGRVQTYVAPIQVAMGYERQWTADVRSRVSIAYVGQRWADVRNTRVIDGFIDLRTTVTYSVSRVIDAEIHGENLVNSSVYLWNGYRGRGIFVRLGLLWKM